MTSCRNYLLLQIQCDCVGKKSWESQPVNDSYGQLLKHSASFNSVTVSSIYIFTFHNWSVEPICTCFSLIGLKLGYYNKTWQGHCLWKGAPCPWIWPQMTLTSGNGGFLEVRNCIFALFSLQISCKMAWNYFLLCLVNFSDFQKLFVICNSYFY